MCRSRARRVSISGCSSAVPCHEVLCREEENKQEKPVILKSKRFVDWCAIGQKLATLGPLSIGVVIITVVAGGVRSPEMKKES